MDSEIGGGDMKIEEMVKMAISLQMKSFLKNKELGEVEFPSSLNKNERKYLHEYAKALGLNCKSRGKAPNRFVTVFKKQGSSIIEIDAAFDFGRMSQHHIIQLLQRYPVNDKERKELLQNYQRDSRLNSYGNCAGNDFKELNCTTGRLSSIIPQIPPNPRIGPQGTDFIVFRQSLPIWNSRNDIMQALNNHNIVIISGDSGCGKSTQVPQFILEYSSFTQKTCRIIATEPRRLAAYSVAERVAQERGENIGQAVGYQIRLESKVSPRTLLTFCTNGVLLRTLMGGENSLSTVTHLIVDEVHERDKFSDLLLLVLRDLAPKYRNLKLILISSTMNTDKFREYFGGCPVIRIPGVCYDVTHYFLEDVLKITNYESDEMIEYKVNLKDKESKCRNLLKWCQSPMIQKEQMMLPVGHERSVCFDLMPSYIPTTNELLNQADKLILNLDLQETVDRLLEQCWKEGGEDSWKKLLHLYLTEGISLDYKHSLTGITALIAAAAKGKMSFIELILDFGANLTVCTPNDWNAIIWAKHFNHTEVHELLLAYWNCIGEAGKASFQHIESINESNDNSVENQYHLDSYYQTIDKDIDVDLILHLIRYIFLNFDTKDNKGAILVFLAGYDEIVTLRERILADKANFDSGKYVIYALHSQMQSSDQRKIFKTVPSDVRKIILSTKLAETSVTIDDVVYVIDSGIIKEKYYDGSMDLSHFTSKWISKTNVIQRRSRAGRCSPGICFHLFSKVRFDKMAEQETPEILRVPIHELCLQTKLLSSNVSIADFFSKAMDLPSIHSINESVRLLKVIEALDSNEQLTELGLHLLDLPVEPNLGKMILYSVTLKCLDPVLTIVCSLAYCDPFIIPNKPSKKRVASNQRKKLSENTYSDHMILLRGFQNWQKARNEGYEKSFCEQNFISAAAMEMIVGMRAQLLGQLRASGFVRARGPGDIRDLNTNSENWSVVKAALCAGCYPNMMRIDHRRKQMITQKETDVRFHPTSVMNSHSNILHGNIMDSRELYSNNLPSEWFIFQEKTKLNRISYAKYCTLISPVTVSLFTGLSHLPPDGFVENDPKTAYPSYAEPDSDSESEDPNEKEKAILKLDEWITFRIHPDIARLTVYLRQKWYSLFLRRMNSPSKPMSPLDEAVIKTIVEVLATEEHNLGLSQPVGVGQRPRPMAAEYCPPVSNTTIQSPVQRAQRVVRGGYSPKQQAFRPLSKNSPKFKK